jgi:CO/xanthine dehydrogenase FAD-binding subunit
VTQFSAPTCSDDERIITAAVGAGGVAPVPLRLTAVESVESLLLGRHPDPDVLAAAADAATAGFHPLEQPSTSCRCYAPSCSTY